MTKSRLDSARKEEEQLTSGVKVRSEARVRKNWSDMENEFGSSEPTFHSSRKVKKLVPQPATRQSQTIDLRYEHFFTYFCITWQCILSQEAFCLGAVRASVREVEAVTEGNHRRNRPPHAERTNVPLPETRRSVSLPRGKFAPV
jgi:kinesin family protein C2/C3